MAINLVNTFCRVGCVAICALTVAGAQSTAFASDRLVMPFSCNAKDGGVSVRPSAPRAHRVLSRPERRIIPVCSPHDSRQCRDVEVLRFDLLCDSRRIAWREVAAAISILGEQQQPRADPVTLISVPRVWLMPSHGPCARLLAHGDRRVPLPPPLAIMRRHCETAWAGEGLAPVRWPNGFAPLEAAKAELIKVIERPDPPGSHASVARGAVQRPPHAVPPPRPQEPPRSERGEITAALEERAHEDKTAPMGRLQFSEEPGADRVQDPAATAPIAPADAEDPPAASQPVPQEETWWGAFEATLAAALLMTSALVALLFRRRKRDAPVERAETWRMVRVEPILALPCAPASRAMVSLAVTRGTPARRAAEAEQPFGLEMPRSRGAALAVLGLRPGASPGRDVVKRIINELRRRWHPDRARDAEDLALRNHRIRQVNAAWEILSGKRGLD